MTPALRVVSPGALTTVQDDGRLGALRHGVPRGGAMDRFALLAANRLLDNPAGAAALEVTAGGVTLEVLGICSLAVAGADLGATLSGRPLPPWTAVLARRGDVVALPGRRGGWGARAYLAVGGGVDVPPVLGSRSTDLAGRFGGLHGRALRAGDLLAAGEPASEPLLVAGRRWPAWARPPYGPEPTLRFLPGPHADCFAPDVLAAVAGLRLQVSERSNRMGYRLEGARLPYVREVSLPSLGVIPGAIQVPPDGQPILLMADAQTTGGYPILGVVVAADLPLAAQALPGDYVRLAPLDAAAALEARRALAAWSRPAFTAGPCRLELGLAGAPAHHDAGLLGQGS